MLEKWTTTDRNDRKHDRVYRNTDTNEHLIGTNRNNEIHYWNKTKQENNRTQRNMLLKQQNKYIETTITQENVLHVSEQNERKNAI